MRAFQTISILGVLASVASLQSAAAGEPVSADGVMNGVSRAEVHVIAQDHVVIMEVTDYAAFEASDAGNPLNGAGGPCFGKVEIVKGLPSGDGYCDWIDADGMRLVIAWTTEGADDQGASIGNWRIFGGEGVWAAATGGGAFAVTRTEGAVDVVNRVSGEITLP